MEHFLENPATSIPGVEVAHSHVIKFLNARGRLSLIDVLQFTPILAISTWYIHKHNPVQLGQVRLERWGRAKLCHIHLARFDAGGNTFAQWEAITQLG